MDFFTTLKKNINEYIVANGNKEITADILRPILLEICNITFEKMGDLELLQTVYKDDLVGAINEALNAESGVKIHYGDFPNPNNAVIPNFELGDFYAQQGDTGIDSFWQYNGQKWVKIADSNGGSATYTDDIPVILSSGKSLGRYTNGQTIPAAGKTMQEVMELIAQEYLAPSVSAFAINQTSPIEVGTVISGNKNFTFSFSQSQNVEQNSVKIIDAMTNTVLAENLLKSSPQSVDIGTVVKLETDSHVWRIEAKNTQGATIQRNSSPVSWRFRWFFGGSATDITDSAQARALSDSLLESANVQFVAGTGHTDFYFLIHDKTAIYSVTDLTALNADITSAYVLQGTMTVNDNGGNPQTYKKYKLSLASAYTSPHTHEFKISYL